MIRTDLLTSYDFTDYICPMCGNYGTLLGVLGQLVHMRCAGCGCDYDFDYPHDDLDLQARIDERAEEDAIIEEHGSYGVPGIAGWATQDRTHF